MTTASNISPIALSDEQAAPRVASRTMISREGELALHRELDELLDKRDNQLPRRLRSAREFGEATGNDDYLQIMEEEAINSARIESIRAILASAEVTDESGEEGVVGLGSVVTMQGSGRSLERRLLGAHEPVGSDGVSAASPIGRAIFGARVGETVVAELPSGSEIELEIVAVRNPHPAQSPAADPQAATV